MSTAVRLTCDERSGELLAKVAAVSANVNDVITESGEDRRGTPQQLVQLQSAFVAAGMIELDPLGAGSEVVTMYRENVDVATAHYGRGRTEIPFEVRSRALKVAEKQTRRQCKALGPEYVKAWNEFTSHALRG